MTLAWQTVCSQTGKLCVPAACRILVTLTYAASLYSTAYMVMCKQTTDSQTSRGWKCLCYSVSAVNEYSDKIFSDNNGRIVFKKNSYFVFFSIIINHTLSSSCCNTHMN